MNKLTEEIISTLSTGFFDYPERILEEQGIECSSMTEEEINNKTGEILDEFEYVDEELDYYDLMKSYEDMNLYYKHNDKLYCVKYRNSDYTGIDILCNPYEVEPYEITITKYRAKNETY